MEEYECNLSNMDAEQLPLFPLNPARMRRAPCAVCGRDHARHPVGERYVEPIWPAPEPAEQLDLLDELALVG